MIKVMAVDDELPALRMAESVLRTFHDVELCGLFNNPEELLNILHTVEADLIFVDMKMPAMNGLELAERIHQLRPNIGIAFVTAYDYYAVDAFESEAFDYVMKPMNAGRIRKTLDRFVKKQGAALAAGTVGNAAAVALAERIAVRSFGHFYVETSEGDALKLRRVKTEELFAYLIHQQGKPVSAEHIMDALWGDRDAERAQSILYTTIYQLRKGLESIGLFDVIEHFRSGGGRYRLSWTPYQWDCDEFERVHARLSASVPLDEARSAVKLYRDGYLTENGYDWAESRRAELELKYIELLDYVIAAEVRIQRFEFALSYLHQWEAHQPFAERLHAKIIALHLLMGNKEAAVMHERVVRELFMRELGMPVNLDTEVLALSPMSVF
ncbi:response regulator [Paenibacillus sp. CAU 1782]